MKKKDKRILIIEKRILKNLKTPPTIEELSAWFGITDSHLRQRFKQETGLPFGKYIHHHRLEKARELLETTFMRVQEVATAVGIFDQSYFNRDFKERYGLTPGKYHEENCIMFKSINESNEK